MKFHISDVLSVISGTVVSYPECPPIDGDHSCSKRSDPLEGMLQLIEYAAGDKVFVTVDPNTGVVNFDREEMERVGSRAMDNIRRQYPDMADVKQSAPDFSQIPEDQWEKVSCDWVESMALHYGEYLEIKKPHRHMIRGDDAGRGFSLN